MTGSSSLELKRCHSLTGQAELPVPPQHSTTLLPLFLSSTPPHSSPSSSHSLPPTSASPLPLPSIQLDQTEEKKSRSR
ncbi:uncharacterized protein DFL_002249 [Arthrobotrys flagrans]|uniref:Uncharacterized protein n=1 Tax=Arthrobotrys flagrans TaxID=97331 RepID=A0A437AAA5_ARTFL|nr:hypothetical protein DFL_002249 [Arthrobotrys flagrans]